MILVAILASGAIHGAVLSGSVQTADGDPVASTIVILTGSGSTTVESHDAEADGTFSIGIPSGAVSATDTATDPASHEVDLSNGVPSNVRFVLGELGFFSGMLTDRRGPAVCGGEVRVRNLDTDRRIDIDRYSTDVTDSDGNITIAVPFGSSDRFFADI